MTSNREHEGGYTWTTYAQRLEDAGISWKVYQHQDNYGCNVLEYFKAFKKADRDSALYTKGMVRSPEGQFEYDAINDMLPAVSWIIPPRFQSEHPDYMSADGAAFVASKIDAIAANLEAWAKTVFVLNYDENDGIFDHVAPPLPPAGTPREFVQSEPIGGGFRVPCIIVSPWTAGGWVCSHAFDHTSVLQFLEKFMGSRNLTSATGGGKRLGPSPPPFGLGTRRPRPPYCRTPAARLSWLEAKRCSCPSRFHRAPTKVHRNKRKGHERKFRGRSSEVPGKVAWQTSKAPRTSQASMPV